MTNVFMHDYFKATEGVKGKMENETKAYGGVRSSGRQTRGQTGIAEFTGLKNAGLDNDGRSRRSGHCRTGQ